MKTEDLMKFIFSTQNQLRMLHWQTESFARHQAYGTTYDTLNNLFDEFIEIYQGKNGKIEISKAFNVEVFNINDDKISSFIANSIETLNSFDKMLTEKDTDLFNLRDEMLGAFNKLKYLLTLK